MKKSQRLLLLCFIGVLLPSTTQAQIIPDSTVGTQLTPNININGLFSDRVDGGTVRGSNLFHSFQDFNIHVNRGVYFTNPTYITNILTRVTGSNPSNINGTLGVLGNANLFFLNPNGIIFGANGRLDLQGSFLGTTASSINFADGTIFSTLHNQSESMLTVSVPVGLGFGSNPQPITVQGTGHKLNLNSSLSPITRNPSSTELKVSPGKTLALVGGDININGGTLTAEKGRIELGSVQSGSVINFSSSPQGLMVDYSGVEGFGNIQLTQRALADVSGSGAGFIKLQGNKIHLGDGSVLLLQGQGTEAGGDVIVNASESLTISGVASNVKIRSGIASENMGSARGGSVAISTRQLNILEGGGIHAKTFGTGNGAKVNIVASETIQLSKNPPSDPSYTSFINTNTYSQNNLAGKAGELTVSTRQLALQDGGIIISQTLGRGASGNVTVNADSVELIGMDASLTNLSLIGSISFGTGNSGNVIINTQTLAVRNSSAVSSASFSSGLAGNIIINASESVEVSGKLPKAPNPSQIRSSVAIASPIMQRIFGLPSNPTGNSGNVIINTPSLNIKNEGAVSVSNEGVGNAGALVVNADSIILNNQAKLKATTASGEGGNISVRARALQLRDNSNITTEAKKNGNGGNISLNIGAIALLEESKISANAGLGKGGEINISTQGLFQSRDTAITATSGIGIDGQISITSPDIKQESVLQEQASNFMSTERLVVDSCLANKNQAQRRFVVTGNGGISETPSNDLNLHYSVAPVHTVNTSTVKNPHTTIVKPGWKIGDAINEAVQLSKTSDGRLILVTTQNPNLMPTQNLTCHPM